MQRCYNASKAECIKWAKVLANTKDCIAEKETLTFRLLDQIQQLYGLMCNRNGETPEFGRDQVDQQLDVIKNEVEFFQEVIVCSRRLQAEEKKSKVALKGSEK